MNDHSETSEPVTFGETAKQTFLAWERLRLLYNFLLTVLTLFLARDHLLRGDVIIVILEGAIVANMFFFAGPVVETYVLWLGYEETWVRWLLFIGGTLLSAFLTVFTLFSLLFYGHH